MGFTPELPIRLTLENPFASTLFWAQLCSWILDFRPNCTGFSDRLAGKCPEFQSAREAHLTSLAPETQSLMSCWVLWKGTFFSNTCCSEWLPLPPSSLTTPTTLSLTSLTYKTLQRSQKAKPPWTSGDNEKQNATKPFVTPKLSCRLYYTRSPYRWTPTSTPTTTFIKMLITYAVQFTDASTCSCWECWWPWNVELLGFWSCWINTERTRKTTCWGQVFCCLGVTQNSRKILRGTSFSQFVQVASKFCETSTVVYKFNEVVELLKKYSTKAIYRHRTLQRYVLWTVSVPRSRTPTLPSNLMLTLQMRVLWALWVNWSFRRRWRVCWTMVRIRRKTWNCNSLSNTISKMTWVSNLASTILTPTTELITSTSTEDHFHQNITKRWVCRSYCANSIIRIQFNKWTRRVTWN